jgi:hypothetical protein
VVTADELLTLIAARHEWLLVHENGRSFPIDSAEMDVYEDSGKTFFGFIDDAGYHSWRLNGFSPDNGEISIDVAGPFGRKRETLRLVPRVTAAELSAEVEAARLEAANAIAAMIPTAFPASKVTRVAINAENGRIANFEFVTSSGKVMAAIADVTGTVVSGLILATAMIRSDKLSARKKLPVSEMLVIVEKRHSRNAQKLHALLNSHWRGRISIAWIDRTNDPPTLELMPERRLSSLLATKESKFRLPERQIAGRISRRIIEVDPKRIDVIFSKHGETLRYSGLPFLRVRRILGRERAWFGVGKQSKELDEHTWPRLIELIDDLARYRNGDAPSKRHRYFRTASEAWLESILRRDVTTLDGNLILSPIYDQFRSAGQKLDLLAIRKDGRLVIIEIKTRPDRDVVFQAADYWRKIEQQRRRGELNEANLFDGRAIADKPAIIYLVSPAWSVHPDLDRFVNALTKEIEIWRFELHENWRAVGSDDVDAVKVAAAQGRFIR